MRIENLARTHLLISNVDDKHSASAFDFPLDVDEARIQQFAQSSRGIVTAAECSQERRAATEPTNAVRLRGLVVHTLSIAGQPSCGASSLRSCLCAVLLAHVLAVRDGDTSGRGPPANAASLRTERGFYGKVEWQPSLDARAASNRTLNVQRATNATHALAHRVQPKVARKRTIGIEAAAVILYAQDPLGLNLLQRHLDAPGTRVFCDVLQRLLCYPIQRLFRGEWHLGLGGRAEVNDDRVARRNSVGLLVEG